MSEIKDPKFWASICAWAVPVVILVGVSASRALCWNVSETFTFVGALAGPFAALAGFFYIYATFQLQSDQFREDQTNQMFFRLLDSFILLRDRIHYNGDSVYRNMLIKTGNSEEELKSVQGEESFSLHNGFLGFWATSSGGWRVLAKNIFDKRGNDYEYVPYRKGFTMETSSQKEIKFLFQATLDEASFGSYLRSIKYLLGFCLKNNKPEFLSIIEANQGRDERVFLFYYLSLIEKPGLRDFLVENGYLQSVAKKHLLSKNHYKFLYKESNPSSEK
ncbi:hypothetical protein [Algoriphagus sp. Y33]|uniref:hypothetical protein n=1 Tax=Algoriphagus sp. Y33 TaxID=2772483 RepID=UPI0017837763|nr:hypothetical protein [Algoriphagus sp. Y33]